MRGYNGWGCGTNEDGSKIYAQDYFVENITARAALLQKACEGAGLPGDIITVGTGEQVETTDTNLVTKTGTSIAKCAESSSDECLLDSTTYGGIGGGPNYKYSIYYIKSKGTFKLTSDDYSCSKITYMFLPESSEPLFEGSLPTLNKGSNGIFTAEVLISSMPSLIYWKSSPLNMFKSVEDMKYVKFECSKEGSTILQKLLTKDIMKFVELKTN